MDNIYIADSYNYIEAYLTFACNMSCAYCINKHNSTPKYSIMSGTDWIRALNRISTRDDLPITLGGGEPTLHSDFYSIVNNIRGETNLDLLTNGTFDIREFMKHVPPDRFKRDSKYASIRFSYHSGYTDTNMLLAKICRMMQEGYSVGVWAVMHPECKRDIKHVKKVAEDIGIDFRVKEFLGYHKGKLYGTYEYKFAVANDARTVDCKPSELLIAPDGSVHRCHHNLYSNVGSYTNIVNEDVKLLTDYKVCRYCGFCNPCDCKQKFDRFQKKGWCAVDIKPLEQTFKESGGCTSYK